MEFGQRSDYVVARVTGPADSATIKLLVIEALEATLPLSEVHSAAAQVAKVVKGVIIAFIDEREEDYENNRLGEAIAAVP